MHHGEHAPPRHIHGSGSRTTAPKSRSTINIAFGIREKDTATFIWNIRNIWRKDLTEQELLLVGARLSQAVCCEFNKVVSGKG